MLFDEVKHREDGSLFTLGVSTIALELEPGHHSIESMDPYTWRYLRVVALDAPVLVEALWVREYANPSADRTRCNAADPELTAIFEAARQTFRTNGIDLFTDCMSRERGGYPCDSWFTARAERVFTGESCVERNFLENYFLMGEFSSIPAGMVPHCYPSDRLGKGQYIPNWGMWLVLQLAEYCLRTDDTDLRALAAPRVRAMVDFFAPFFNKEGLLEDLPGWVFVEWSEANQATGGVNFPTNMLYAAMLKKSGRLYGNDDWVLQADGMIRTIRSASWDGRFFADQSLRSGGVLQRSSIRTETCQYHAFYFGVSSPRSHPALWSYLRNHWGPVPALPDAPPHAEQGVLAPANMLYGYMLRFDLLLAYEEWELLLEEVRKTFGPQTRLTGTLWENFTPTSSCNHGFASCAAEYIVNGVEALGLERR